MSSARPAAPLWEPSAEELERAAMTRFMRWAGERHGRDVRRLRRAAAMVGGGARGLLGGHLGVLRRACSPPYERVLERARCPARAGSRAPSSTTPRTCCSRDRRRRERGGVHASELRPLGELTWGELSAQVAAIAGGLRALGVGRGDRVVAYMPNIPETLVAFLRRPASARSGRAPRPSSARAA